MTIISATSAIDRTILVLFWLSAVLVINLPSHGKGIGYRLDMSKVDIRTSGSTGITFDSTTDARNTGPWVYSVRGA